MSERLDSQIDEIEKRIRAEDPTAIERAAQLAEQYPNELRVLKVLAFAHSMNDDIDGAIAATNRMMTLAPSEPGLLHKRGGYEHERGNLEAALADFTAGIELSKQLKSEYYLSSLYFLRADVLVKLGRKAEALADLEHVSDDHFDWLPEKRTKYAILADIEGERRPWKAMSEPLDSLLEELRNRAFDDIPTALERVKTLVEQYPKNPDVWEMLADVHAKNGDVEAAFEATNRLIEVSPTDVVGHFSRGHYQHRRGNLEAALADLDKAIALGIEHQADEHLLMQFYFRRADVLVALGRKAEARADLAHVPDGYGRYTTRLRMKADILADCEG